MPNRLKLTLRVVNAAGAVGKSLFLWDSEVIGLGLHVRPSGHKSYVLQYRHRGRSRRYVIGTHGSPWTPETARSEALRLLGEVAAEVDVQGEKVERRRDLTVAELCDLYLEVGLATRKPSSVVAARSDIENHIKPMLGSRKAADITRADVEQLLLAVAAGVTARRAKTKRKRGLSRVRGGKGAANSSIQILSAALGFAVARGLRPDNPVIGVRKYPERKLERFLSAAEFARLGEALAAAASIGVESPYAIAAIRLLALTGCRRNEVLTLKRSYVDYQNQCLRLPDSKTGAKVVHIGPAVLEVIRGIPEVTGNPYLLPAKCGVGCINDIQPPWDRIRKAAGLDDVRLHDLRHSFASFGVNSGDSLPVVGALLGHASSKTTERYAHLAAHSLKGAAGRISLAIAGALGCTISDPLETGERPPNLSPEEAASASSVLGKVIKTRWLDTQAAAKQLGLTVGTLQTYRWMGIGPAFNRIGRRIVYSEADLSEWRTGLGRQDGSVHQG